MKSLLLKSCAVALVTAAAGAFTSPAEAACGAKGYGGTCSVNSTPLYSGSYAGAWKGHGWNNPSPCGYKPCQRPAPVVVPQPVVKYIDRVVEKPVHVRVPVPVRVAVPVKVPVAVPVPRPYPVRVAVPVRVPVPVPVVQRVPVRVAVPVPVRVAVPVPHPVPVRVAVPVDRPVAVPVPRPVPVRVPVPVERRVAVPVPQPYPVPVHQGSACGGGQFVDPICGGGHQAPAVPYAAQGGFGVGLGGGFAGGFGGHGLNHADFGQHSALGLGHYGGMAGPLVHGASERISRISARIADGQNNGILTEAEAKALRADMQQIKNTIDEARKKGTEITAEHEVHGKIAGLEQKMFHSMINGDTNGGSQFAGGQLGHGFGPSFAGGFGYGMGAPLGFGGHGAGFGGYPAQPPVPANWRF